MIDIKYVVGDVREPIGYGRKLICHCCNDLGKMGSGVAKALMIKLPPVRSEYITWSKKESFGLGKVQAVKVEKDIAVINMIGQRDIKVLDNVPPIRYGAMKQCLEKVETLAQKYDASIHIPYLMGSDSAGGVWGRVEKIIIEELCEKDIHVIVYDIFNKRGEG